MKAAVDSTARTAPGRTAGGGAAEVPVRLSLCMVPQPST
jgi:hypothetical protein